MPDITTATTTAVTPAQGTAETSRPLLDNNENSLLPTTASGTTQSGAAGVVGDGGDGTRAEENAVSITTGADATSDRGQKAATAQHHHQYHYGLPILVGSSASMSSSHSSSSRAGVGSGSTITSNSRGYQHRIGQQFPLFPEVGSVLGHFFCLSRLGKGTFSSIHQCINLSCYHRDDAETSSTTRTETRHRMAAAKVELADFQQSGVLEAEAVILDFLHRSLPEGVVPVYMGHFKDNKCSAIMMEYLPGEDMHQLREEVMRGTTSRRIDMADAVYLAADVMIPLLKHMHTVGIVHRDVKPSNCVRSGLTDNDRSFCLVDFGLSKSVVVPADSDVADMDRPWAGQDWLRPTNYTGKAYYRKERKKADFRGTSMYASLRVHQGYDYCPRDDMWSLMYVFCDLVSGGLPWMSHAANRDRDGCHKLKELVHGDLNVSADSTNSDQTSLLLMGDEYHVASYRRERSVAGNGADSNNDNTNNSLEPVPAPLNMAKDETKVRLLRNAFQHLGKLGFCDQPDYEFLQECIRGFLTQRSTAAVPDDPTIRPVVWVKKPPEGTRRASKFPEWDGWTDTPNPDPLFWDTSNIFEIAEKEVAMSVTENTSGGVRSRLSLRNQFQLAQMEHNAACSNDVAGHVALHDWMSVVLPLLYGDWDAKKYEEGGHRTSTDGYRRDGYLQLLEVCWACAQSHKLFRSPSCIFEVADGMGVIVDCDTSSSTLPSNKRRKVDIHSIPEYPRDSDLRLISKTFLHLQYAIKLERAKRPAPPVRISFA